MHNIFYRSGRSRAPTRILTFLLREFFLTARRIFAPASSCQIYVFIGGLLVRLLGEET